MVAVNPPMMKSPPKLIADPELRRYFEYLDYYLYQLWLRTGGGDDFIADAKQDISDLTVNVRSVAGDTTQIEKEERIFVDATAGDVTITLLGASAAKYCNVIKGDSTANKVIVSSVDNINGQTTQELKYQYESIECGSDTTTWNVL